MIAEATLRERGGTLSISNAAEAVHSPPKLTPNSAWITSSAP